MRIKSIALLLMTVVLSAFLLTACGQSDTGEVKTDTGALKTATSVLETDTGALKINFVAFDQTKPPSLKSVSGLAGQERFGIWSKEKAVVFEFDKPLPPKFSLIITGHVLGPNVGQNFKASVGSDVQVFTWASDKAETKTVTLENAGRSKTLTIEIPIPTRPIDLNMNKDGRKLGLAFYELSIQPL